MLNTRSFCQATSMSTATFAAVACRGFLLVQVNFTTPVTDLRWLGFNQEGDKVSYEPETCTSTTSLQVAII